MISAHLQTLNPGDSHGHLYKKKTRDRAFSFTKKGRMLSFLVGRVLVSRTDDADSSARVPKVPKLHANPDKRESVHYDSGAVAMEVGIR